MLDTDSFDYGRFINHLRYFLYRKIRQQEDDTDDLDPIFLKTVKQKYPKAYETVEKIAQFLYQKEGWQLGENERLYLSLHVWRVTRKYQDK